MTTRTGPTSGALLLASGLLLLTSCGPNQANALLQPPEALGTVVAQEAIRLAGARKQVALISPDASWGEVSTVEQAFRKVMKKQGVAVTVAKAANLGNPMRQAAVGLKAADFIEAVQKSTDAGAIVCLAGAPLLSPGDAARIPTPHPPVLVVATASLGNVPGVWGDRALLGGLLESQAIQLAVIDNPQPAPSADKVGDTRQLFSQHYLIVPRQD